MHPNQPPIVTSEERTWAMFAHLGAVAGLVLSIGVLGWAVPLVIWLLKRRESRFVAFHALEELLFQLVWFALLTCGGLLTVMLMFVLVGFLLLPVLVVLYIVPIVWSIIAAVQASQGEWYLYPIVGRWAWNSLSGP